MPYSYQTCFNSLLDHLDAILSSNCCSILVISQFHDFHLRPIPLGVALVLCQSDPVLNDGRSKGDASRKAVIDGVRKKLIEKVVADHEDDDDGSSSD